MPIDENIRRLLANTRIVVYPDDFTIVSIDWREEAKVRRLLRDMEAFSSVTFEAAEISLVMRADRWAELRNKFSSFREEGPYRLITFDIVLELSVVGFMALVSAKLAEAGVSIYPLSTFLRDHILVRAGDADRAMVALRELVKECGKGR
jgi:hypothetical protein